MPFDQTNFEPADAILEALVTARGLIDEPRKWWRGHGDGFNKYCILTATGEGWQISGGDGPDDGHMICGYLRSAVPAITTLGVANYNDAATTTHAMVIAVMDRAIAARRADLLAETGARS